MIIFSLDALADDSHRRHLIDPRLNSDYEMEIPKNPLDIHALWEPKWVHKSLILTSYPPQRKEFVADYEAYNAACDGDKPVEPVIHTLVSFMNNEKLEGQIQIWNSRSNDEDALYYEKTLTWLTMQMGIYGYDYSDFHSMLKMRPLNDDSPQEELFYRWCNEYHASLMPGIEPLSKDSKYESTYMKSPIEMVFSSHKPTIEMFKRRNVFVFDCGQT